MTKINLDEDERYPVYGIREPRESRFEPTVDVHPSTLARWRRVIAEYEQVQDEMGDLHDEAYGKKQAENTCSGSIPSVLRNQCLIGRGSNEMPTGM